MIYSSIRGELSGEQLAFFSRWSPLASCSAQRPKGLRLELMSSSSNEGQQSKLAERTMEVECAAVDVAFRNGIETQEAVVAYQQVVWIYEPVAIRDTRGAGKTITS